MAGLWRGLATALVSEEPGCVNGHGSSTGRVGMDYMLLISAGLPLDGDRRPAPASAEAAVTGCAEPHSTAPAVRRAEESVP